MSTPTRAASAPSVAAIGVRRTLRVYLALALGAVPLCQIFTDTGWLLDIWLAGAVTLLPVVLLRLWSRPRFVHLFAGAAIAVVWLTARFVPTDAWGGLIPSGRTWQDVHAMLTTFGSTVSTQTAPLATTPEIRLVLAGGFCALVLLVDSVAVVARHPAVAALPLLVIYTVSGAVPRQAVSWVLFLPAALGFLLLISSDSTDVLTRWGRLMPRHRGAPDDVARPVTTLARAGRQIGVIAVVVALALPLLLPGRDRNAISDALHNPTGNGTGTGTGSGPGIALNPFVSLHGQLVREQPQTLFSVNVGNTGGVEPFYVRANVLDVYTGTAWVANGHGSTQRLSSTSYTTQFPQPGPTAAFQARFTVQELRDTPPLFGTPENTDGLSGRAGWSSQDAVVVGSTVSKGAVYSENVRQLRTSPDALRAAPAATGPQFAPYLQLPTDIPTPVGDLVQRLTAGTGSPYAATLAMLRYLSPANGFTYSLQTRPGDSGSDLVDFLITNKTGYCQQYAAGLATMMRLAGIPARIVLGYTHSAPDKGGRFTVSTADAHAWVEAYFGGIGWVPFDPTPLTGSDAGRAVPLPWSPNGAQNPLPTASASTAPTAAETSDPSQNRATVAPTTAASTVRADAGAGSSLTIVLQVLVGVGVVLFLLSLPALVRLLRRGRRLRAGRAGDTDALWAELAATATDLGYVLSPARSPRQLAGALGAGIDADSRTALGTLAMAVERSRYAGGNSARGSAASGDASGDLSAQLTQVETALRRRRPGRDRLLARLRPASLRPAARSDTDLGARSALSRILRAPRRH